MNVNFYSFSKRPNSTKRPTGNGTVYSCTLIDGTSILTPVLGLKLPSGETFINKNYCYISAFERYYYVTDIAYDLGVWKLSLAVDVLATAKIVIGNSTQYVMRSASDYDGEIIDTAYPTKTEQDYELITSDYGSIWGSTDPYFIVGIIGGMGIQSDQVVGGAYNGSVVYYGLTHDQLYQLMYTLLDSDDLFNTYNIPTSEISLPLQKQLINPIQYIHSIKCVPFTPSFNPNYSAVGFYCGFNYVQIKEFTPNP